MDSGFVGLIFSVFNEDKVTKVSGLYDINRNIDKVVFILCNHFVFEYLNHILKKQSGLMLLKISEQIGDVETCILGLNNSLKR